MDKLVTMKKIDKARNEATRLYLIMQGARNANGRRSEIYRAKRRGYRRQAARVASLIEQFHAQR